MANYYCANWGNDNNDGLAWETAKRSFQASVDISVNNDSIYFKGFYNENVSPPAQRILIGDKVSSIIDGTKLSGSFNIYARRYTILQNWLLVVGSSASASYGNIFKNCIINSIYSRSLSEDLHISNNNYTLNPRSSIGNDVTLYSKNINNILSYGVYEVSTWIGGAYSWIIANWSIDQAYITVGLYKYSLFINCKFKFRGGGLGTDETTFEYPIGATDEDKIQNLKDRMVIVYGGVATDYLIGCKYYSGADTDIFVDPSVEDFHLVPNCIAAHMSFSGDYIGALKEGHKYDWNTDWASIVNIDSNGNIIDQTVDASAESNIIDIGYVRKINDFSILGQRALRNGNQVNIVSNLGNTITAGSSVLTNAKTYQVRDNTITLDDSGGTVLQPFECFVANDEGGGVGLGFAGTGTVKEVLIDNYDPKIQIKCSRTDATLASAVTITCKLSDSPVMVNVDGGGEPTHGSADAGYDSGTAVQLSTRYIKMYLLVKANQLEAR